ncbi:MAG: EamA family transporter [Candidatus Bathyarchaeia archaeon]
MNSKPISTLNAFLMITLIMFWGSSFVVVKIALVEGLTPIAIATYRFLVAGALFLLILFFKKARNYEYSLHIERKDFATLMILALTGVVFFFTAQYTGIQMAGASIAAILVCLLSPIMITVFSTRIFKEKLSKKQVLGVAVAACGTFAVVAGSERATAPSNAEPMLGSLILLSTPFLWTAYTLIGKKTMEKYDAFLVVAYVNMLGGICLVPFSLLEGSAHLALNMSLYGWLAILFLSVTCSVLGYYIWFHVLRQTDASKVSSFLFAEPLITVAFAVAFVNETINLYVAAGGSLIFTGVYLVNKK